MFINNRRIPIDFPGVLTFVFTLRYLKPVQIYGRALYALKRQFYRVNGLTALRKKAAELKPTLQQPQKIQITFDFLNVKETYPLDSIKWVDNTKEKLWRYNQHYFDFLLKNNYTKEKAIEKLYLVLDWIEKNSYETTEAWEPFVISKRVVNWTKWLKDSKYHFTNDDEIRLVIYESICIQCKRLYQDIEYHVQANHLFENLKALFITAAFLIENGYKVNHFINQLIFSAKELTIEINEQILDDGGHYEVTPMYHEQILSGMVEINLAAGDALEIENLSVNQVTALEKLHCLCSVKIKKMKHWLSFMVHPDGKFSLFNDTSLIKPKELDEEHELLQYTDSFEFFENSGYFIRHWGGGFYFIIDSGSPSPEYQPGHSHCDSMSYELSLAGQRVIVDTGVGSYQDPSVRNYCRRTAAHNLPVIEGVEQSEIWAFFRMGRRSCVLERNYNVSADTFSCLIADYNGNIFERKVVFEKYSLTVTDVLRKRISAGAFKSLVHIHPDVLVKPEGSNKISLSTPKTVFNILSESNLSVQESKYYPEFGKEMSNNVIIAEQTSSSTISYQINF
ncbi:MAG: heparinase II/III family protein [Nitrospirae bacterium]|nr:heparinase II/III family protein [Nitrospirota bacterium]MBF0533951.1 heparinase II/III family protein [Nitrospirota bacterium]MBF0616110.1 heparinase II/III family protein [Nitrospirota bacterium]